MRNLKFQIITAAAIVIALNSFAYDYNFYLYTNKIFSPGEDVSVSLNLYRANATGNVHAVVYKITDVRKFFSVFKSYTYEQGAGLDSLVRDYPIVKNFYPEAEVKNRSYYYYYREIPLGKLDEGCYLVEAISNGQVAQVPVIVSSYGIVTKQYESEMIAYVTDKNSGKAADDFEILAIYKNRPIGGKGKSNGVSRFDFLKGTTIPDYYSQLPLIAYNGDKIAVSQSYFYYYALQTYKIYLYTDRPAYRPKQTVNFKGIIRRRNGNEFSIPGDSAEYRILDATYKEIKKGILPLSGAGSFSGTLELDENTSLGTYSLYAKAKNGWESNTNFRVEEYKKPEYEVHVNLDKTQYLTGDMIHAEISADYFFGSPVKNATVEYKVMRNIYYRPWWYGSRWSWYYEDYDEPWYYYGYQRNAVIKTGTGKIGEDGKLKVDISTDSNDKYNNNYTIVANVTDASRRTITGSKSAIVAYTSFVMSAYSEQYYYEPNDELEIQIHTEDYSGNPVGKNIKATLYDSRYWYDYYKPSTKKVSEKETFTSNETGDGTVRFTVNETGYYRVRVESEDEKEHEVFQDVYVYVLNPNDASYYWWQKNGSGDIEIIANKKTYTAGENIRAMIYVPNDIDALVTVGGNGTEYYEVKHFGGGNAQEIILPTSENTYGKMDLFVGYLKNGAFYQKTMNFSVIPKNKILNVEIAFDKAQYRPGETGVATLRVKDESGKIIPYAEISLGIGDESIYSLYPDITPAIEKTFYSPVYQYNYAMFQNYYSTYSYGNYMDRDALAWRAKRLNDATLSSYYMAEDEWYRYSVSENRREVAGIEGYVLNHATGKPVSSGTVTVGNLMTTNIESSGYYKISAVREGTYDVVFKDNYGKSTKIKDVQFEKGKKIFLSVQIAKNEDKEFSAEQMQVVSDSVAEEMETTGGVPAAYGDGRGATKVANMSLAKAEAETDGDGVVDSKEINFLEAVTRSDFKDAILWEPYVMTNSNGEARVRVKFPDNLTTWRATAKVITNDTKVGEAMVKVIVRKDLLVRMETPRFMTIGDELLIATNIHNYLSSDKTVKVMLTADGVKVDGTEKIIHVKANGEQRVDWKVSTEKIGDAKLTVKALTDEESDAMELKVPVLPYGLQMLMAQSIDISGDGSDKITFHIPDDVNLNSANIQLTLTPSLASTLVSSLDNLLGYPYGCVEQTMSRFLPLVSVANTLKQLQVSTSIDKNEMDKMVAQGFKRLGELQHDDGGWGWWENDATHPFMTAYVVNGLYLADKAGYTQNHERLEKGIEKLIQLIQSGKSVDNTTYAYMMMVAMSVGKKDLWNKYRENPSADANSYTYSLWAQAGYYAGDMTFARNLTAKLSTQAEETGTLAYWGGQKFYYSWQNDNIETTANAVKALSLVDAENKLITPAIRWLMMKRKGNAWYNTRETAITILSLLDYLKQSDELNPDYIVKINGKDQNLHFTRNEVYTKGLTITLKGTDLRYGENKITLDKTGRGKLYASAKLVYFTNKPDADKDKYFSVERTYYKLKKSERMGIHSYGGGEIIYVKEKAEDIKSGDEILVKVSVKANQPQEYILIEDPLPAGCEIITDTKGYNISGENEYRGYDYWRNYYSYYWNYWYSHRENHDEKVSFTITNLGAGTYEYTYLLRAQIPGTFNITPTVVQLMYYPEVRGHGAFDKMMIADKMER